MRMRNVDISHLALDSSSLKMLNYETRACVCVSSACTYLNPNLFFFFFAMGEPLSVCVISEFVAEQDSLRIFSVVLFSLISVLLSEL